MSDTEAHELSVAVKKTKYSTAKLARDAGCWWYNHSATATDVTSYMVMHNCLVVCDNFPVVASLKPATNMHA